MSGDVVLYDWEGKEVLYWTFWGGNWIYKGVGLKGVNNSQKNSILLRAVTQSMVRV